MTRRLTQEQFVYKAREIHGNKYDYSLVKYKTSQIKIKIICKEHGVFEQTPNSHIVNNSGCSRCVGVNKLTSDEFIHKARSVHGPTYDYSKFEYVGNKIKSIIVCKIHGDFLQSPNNHVSKSAGCTKCAAGMRQQSFRLSKESFLLAAKRVHGDVYDYEKVCYFNTHTKVIIVCKVHGEFEQTPNCHVVGRQGCPRCAITVSSIETQWLNLMKIPDTPYNRQVKLKLGNKQYRVDGYIPETKTVYEFYGDYWHGNPLKYDHNMVHPTCKKTYGDLHKKTLQKRQAILNAGYNLVEMWENEWKHHVKYQNSFHK